MNKTFAQTPKAIKLPLPGIKMLQMRQKYARQIGRTGIAPFISDACSTRIMSSFGFVSWQRRRRRRKNSINFGKYCVSVILLLLAVELSAQDSASCSSCSFFCWESSFSFDSITMHCTFGNSSL
jgi:hypothetical protein